MSVLAGATKVLRAYKFDDIANLAEEKAQASQQSQAVVVVGEVNRGKSSLVNSIVGVRDASPVDVNVTTSTAISFVQSTSALPAGTAELLYPGQSQQIAHGELLDWVTVDGKHVRDPSIASLPTRAVVAVNNPTLGEMVVIDTPGVGGLDPSYAKAAQQSAQQACVLVVVCDATTPLTAPEMAFIKDATTTFDSLIVAVTKTDKNVRRWKPIVEENKRLLHKHLGREIAVVGVSSLRAAVATEMPAGPARDAMEQASGIVTLRREIGRRMAVAEHLPAVDGLRTALEGLTKIGAKIDSELEVVKGNKTVIPDLTAELESLKQWKNHSQQWEQYLQRDLTIIRQKAMSELDTNLDQLRERWTARINKNGMAVLRKNPQKFTADMEKELHTAMASAVNLFMEQLYRVVVQPRFESEIVWNGIYQQLAASMQDSRIQTNQVTSKRQGLFDPSMVTMGIMGSSMIGGMIGVTALTVVGPAVGAVWVGVNLGFRAMRAGKTNLLNWLRETIGTTKTTTARLLEGAMALSRPEIVIRYRDHVRDTMEDLQKQINEAKETARQDEATREKTLKRLTNNQRVVSSKCEEAEKLISRITTQQGV